MPVQVDMGVDIKESLRKNGIDFLLENLSVQFGERQGYFRSVIPGRHIGYFQSRAVICELSRSS